MRRILCVKVTSFYKYKKSSKVSSELKAVKNMSEKQGGVWIELVFKEDEPKFCSHIFDRDSPKQVLLPSCGETLDDFISKEYG